VNQGVEFGYFVGADLKCIRIKGFSEALDVAASIAPSSIDGILE